MCWLRLLQPQAYLPRRGQNQVRELRGSPAIDREFLTRPRPPSLRLLVRPWEQERRYLPAVAASPSLPALCRLQSRRPMIFAISSIERMLSSLPGIGRSTLSGSQSVSISATVVMPSFLGLANGVLFFLGIDHHQALRQPVHGAHAVEVAIHLAILAIAAPTASSSSKR